MTLNVEVTWPWSWLHFSGSIEARATMFALFFSFSGSLNWNKHKPSSFLGTWEMRSHVQGHVTLKYKVTREVYIVGLCLFESRDPTNLRIKTKIIVLASLEPEIWKVMFQVTWPWRTRSRVKVLVSVQVYCGSENSYTWETIKKSMLHWNQKNKRSFF